MDHETRQLPLQDPQGLTDSVTGQTSRKGKERTSKGVHPFTLGSPHQHTISGEQESVSDEKAQRPIRRTARCSGLPGAQSER